LQIMTDKDHFLKRIKEMIESGELDRIIQESRCEVNDEMNGGKRKI
jgi:hypothetical protein